MRDLLKGKKGVIFGVANDHSIAYAIAKSLHEQGAELAFNHLPDKDDRGKMEKRVRKAVEGLAPKWIIPCDVGSDSDVQNFFAAVKETFGRIDFVVHSVAFANVDDIRGPTLNASREGFKLAMDISVYSLISIAREAAKLMDQGGSILTMSYYGGEKVVAGYNMMGVCKSALDSTTKYLAYDLGAQKVRVNAISAGPMRTLAASAVGDFQGMLAMYANISPLGRNITPEEVGNSALYLLSDLSTATTGEILHVDCGYNIMGNPGKATDALKKVLAGKE